MGGPSPQVEVEVRDEDDPELLRRRSSGWSLNSLTGRATDTVKKVEEDVAHGLEATEETLREDPKDGAPQKTKKVADQQVEDWASTYSNDEAQAESSASTPPGASGSDARKKASKIKAGGLTVAGLFGSVRNGRRVPLRRTYSQPVTFVDSPASDDDDRGRSRPYSAQLPRHPGASWHKSGLSSPKYGVGEGNPRNHRIESIRAFSRANSPSRSVRFIDEDASRPGSASRSLAVSQIDVTLRGDEEPEPPRSRVIADDGGSSLGGGSASGKSGVAAGGNDTIMIS